AGLQPRRSGEARAGSSPGAGVRRQGPLERRDNRGQSTARATQPDARASGAGAAARVPTTGGASPGLRIDGGGGRGTEVVQSPSVGGGHPTGGVRPVGDA